jgi:uncharacterized protein (DUF983 family)
MSHAFRLPSLYHLGEARTPRNRQQSMDKSPLEPATSTPSRPVSLPVNGGKRLLVGVGRALRRNCPYCSGGGIFDGWFTIKRRCPHCQTVYAYEDGYFLGSYVVNIGFTEILTVLIVVWMLAATTMSVLQMQIVGVTLAVAMPILFYPFALLLWIALDITFHNPEERLARRRK